MEILTPKRFLAIFLVLLLIHGTDARADNLGQRPIQQKIEAGLLYNFLKYTVWPSGKLPAEANKLVVCLYNGDMFGGHLAPMEGRLAQQKEITLHQIQTPSDAKNCHVVILNSSSQEKTQSIIKQLARYPVLTVSEIAGFAELGGMVEFSVADQRVHLRVNQKTLTEANLQVSDRILKLAEMVNQ